jgi:sec-independent protein translocase protein TatB
MLGVSFPELLVIFGVMLVVFGPERLPELARKVGEVLGVVKRHSDTLRKEFYNSVYTPVEEAKLKVRSELKSVSTEMKNVKDPPPHAEKTADEPPPLVDPPKQP